MDGRSGERRAPGGAPRSTASLAPIAKDKFGFDEARHLLWRAGFGGTSAQVKQLVAWGPARSVEYLLNPGAVAFEADGPEVFDKDIMRPPTPEERRMVQDARRAKDEDALARIQAERQQRERKDREQLKSMQRWWLKRMIESPRPLEERLTLFWHGHFATAYRPIENSYHLYAQNRMFRANAMGNFRDLLRGIIRDPAMLAYLNNNQSRKGKPNENLARELMELFSLGVGNYQEQDIKEGARALTGYTFEDDSFVYNARNHDTGAKSILGTSGNLDGDDFVDAILARRECASFIARRLYNFFVADVPPDERGGESALAPEQREALRGLAVTLRTSRYALKPMLRQLFLSEHFYAPAFRGEQIKSPIQLVVGAARSLLVPVRDLSRLADACDLMGQNLFSPPSVKGWDGGRAWINTSTMFVRQNTLAFMIAAKLPGKGFDSSQKTDVYDPSVLLSDLMPEGARNDPAAVVDHLLNLALGRAPDEARSALLAFFAGRKGVVDRDTLAGALLLVTAMPEYQLC